MHKSLINLFNTLLIAVSLSISLSLSAHAQTEPEKTFDFNFVDSPIQKVIERYNQIEPVNFVFDSNIKGKISITNAGKITAEKAKAQLAQALKINSLTFVESKGTTLILNARNAQRDELQVYTKLPLLNYERMVTFVYQLKHRKASDLAKNIRLLTSRDGEMNSADDTNQIIFTDYLGNLHRIKKILDELDRKLK